jgi:hypothetical protein
MANLSNSNLNNMANDLTGVSDNPTKNRNYIIKDIIDELDKIKQSINNNPQESMKSFTTLTMLMGIYSMSDFSKDSIRSMRVLLKNLRAEINEEVKGGISTIGSEEVDGGGGKRRSKKSRRRRTNA